MYAALHGLIATGNANCFIRVIGEFEMVVTDRVPRTKMHPISSRDSFRSKSSLYDRLNCSMLLIFGDATISSSQRKVWKMLSKN